MDALDIERGAALLEATSDVEPSRRRVGPYRLLRELGRGGMGVVYLAERVEGGFEQRVVIKLIKRGMDSDAILRRFLRERQILAGLEHVNVARLFDGGVTDDGQPYFAMEYVDGKPLTAYCDERGLAVEQRLRLFEDACRAVQHAHGKLVVHRDLKPSNMLVTSEGQLKLLDFGIAKLLVEEDDATALTQAGTRLLTPDYAAPEQVRGEPVTTATDVYALGVVLYELLTGRLPYDGDRRGRTDVARAVCEVEPRPPSLAVASQPRLAKRLRGDLDTIVLKALSKEPSRRYASAEALAEDVRRHLAGHPVQARRDTMAYVAAKFVRRHKVGVAAAAVVTLSLLLGLVGTTWQAAVAARERDRARTGGGARGDGEGVPRRPVQGLRPRGVKGGDDHGARAAGPRYGPDRERAGRPCGAAGGAVRDRGHHLAFPRPLRPGADARRAFGGTYAAGVRAGPSSGRRSPGHARLDPAQLR